VAVVEDDLDRVLSHRPHLEDRHVLLVDLELRALAQCPRTSADGE